MARLIEREYTDEELQTHAVATLVDEEEETLLLLEDDETAAEWAVESLLDRPYDIGEVVLTETVKDW